jgi:hypothetical protein
VLKRLLSDALHVVVEAAIGLAGLLLLAGCMLAWRLGQGPIDVTALARRVQASLAAPGARFTIGHAALAWEGFHHPGQLLDVRVRDVAVFAPNGERVLQMPQAAVALSVPELLLLRVVPRRIAVTGAAISLQREADGALRLDFGGNAGPQPAPGGAELLAELSGRGSGKPILPWAAHLHSVQVTEASLTVRDAALGLTWSLPGTRIELHRLPHHGGVAGHAEATFAARALRIGIGIEARLDPDGMQLQARLSPFSPAALAAAVPQLAALSAVDAPVSLNIAAQFDPDLGLRQASGSAVAAAGTVVVAQSHLGVAGARLEARYSPAVLQVTAASLDLAPAPGAAGPAPHLSGHVGLARTGDSYRTSFALAVSDIAFADLSRYWPEGTGGGARPWITQNITAGTARRLQVSGTLDLASDFSHGSLDTLTGGLDGDDMTVWWLRPIPPITHGQAHLAIEGPDALTIAVSAGSQGRLAIRPGASMRITGLSQHDQIGAITVPVTGQLADVLALLAHPRLRLLSRRPVPFTNAQGDLSARLSVRLPLESKVTMDRIEVRATAEASSVHLGDVALGRDLDDGTVRLAVTNDGLKGEGSGTFAGLASAFTYDMDFRAGPPEQVVEHATVSTRVSAAQIAALGYDPGDLASGEAALEAEYRHRRDGTGSIRLAADLSAAGLSTPLGWDKKPGAAASLTARLWLRDGHLAGIDRLRADGPGLYIRSHAEFARPGGSLLHLDRVRIGNTDAEGTVALPDRRGDPYRVDIRGSTLDLSRILDHEAGTGPAPSARPAAPAIPPRRAPAGPPWLASLRFDRVILAGGQSAVNVSAQAEDDGQIVTRAAIAAGEDVNASITPKAAGRHISIAARNAGIVLDALGVADNIRGGRLSLEGDFDDTSPDHTLTGTANMAEFRVTDAPAMGRLLQALTLYGLVDVLRGPGVRFARLIAPFTWKHRVLHLDNARAFSASLGLTARGDLDFPHHQAEIEGTIVPAYFFNQLPGWIPLIGRLFSPEAGGGLFAATYSVRGPMANPKVSVNPLSALTPGFLRGLFGSP